MVKVSNAPWKLAGYLLGYSLIMLTLRKWETGLNTYEYSTLILIPMSFQLLHFYYDAFIWRFSDPHIRKEVGNFIYSERPSMRVKKGGK